jgi:serine/threonine protein phosphatase PrpC
VANVGDSRAIMSADQGKKLFLLSRDYRLNEDNEKNRIVAHGGTVYQTQSK